jgi:hypothetical protein
MGESAAEAGVGRVVDAKAAEAPRPQTGFLARNLMSLSKAIAIRMERFRNLRKRSMVPFWFLVKPLPPANPALRTTHSSEYGLQSAACTQPILK